MSAVPAGEVRAIEHERRAMLELARDFASRELAPRELALDGHEDDAFKQCWARLHELGLERAIAGGALGGSSVPVPVFLSMIEELANGEAGFALCVLLNNIALGMASAEHDGLLDFAGRAAFVAPPLRADPSRHAFQIDHGPEGACASGTNRFALAAFEADAIVFENGAGTALAVVDTAARGVAIGAAKHQLGLRAARAASIQLRDAAATVEDGSGAAPEGESGRALLYLGVAAIARGIARKARAVALDYAKDRRQGGVAIVEHGAVRDMLGSMAARHAGPPALHANERDALAIKTAQTDAAAKTTLDAVQIMGGAGYMRESGLEKLMRDAKYCQLYPEPNWMVRDLIATGL
jgi:acyl-CoA dehydrogenase